jgi:hypothetical protein
LLTIGVLALCIPPPALSAAPIPNTAVHYDPVGDSRAVVIVGSARFTILTPQIIRMEWASERTFEDHASLVFLNRRLSVPQFRHETGDRLAYFPDTAFTELSALEQKLSVIPGAIEAMRDTESSPEFPKNDSDSSFDQPKARLAAYNSAIATAMAHIADISETKPRLSLEKPSGEQRKIPER